MVGAAQNLAPFIGATPQGSVLVVSCSRVEAASLWPPMGLSKPQVFCCIVIVSRMSNGPCERDSSIKKESQLLSSGLRRDKEERKYVFFRARKFRLKLRDTVVSPLAMFLNRKGKTASWQAPSDRKRDVRKESCLRVADDCSIRTSDRK